MKESAVGQTTESSEVGLLDFWEDLSVEGRASIAVFAVSLLSLILVLGCDFTNWLEASLVSNNPVVTRPGFNFTWLAISAFQGYYYSPVLWVVYRIGHSLWGLSPAGYHALAVAFHAGCAVLIFRLGRKLRLSMRAAALAAMLWSVHPLRVESVAWVMDLGRVMGTFFCLAGTLLLFRSADMPDKEGEKERLWLRLKDPRGETAYTFAAVLVILGMLSCSALCLWPLLILVLDALRRLPPDANGLPRVESRQEAYAVLRTRFWDVTPLLVMSVLVAVMGIRAAAIGGLIDGERLWSVGSNFLAGCYVLCFHLVKLALPVRLSAMYQLPQPAGLLQPLYVLCVLGALAYAALAVWSFRRCTWLFAGMCFFVIGLLPYLQIVPCDPAVADRYTYFSSIGLFLALGAAFGYALEKRPAKAFGVSQVELAGYVLLVILVVCSVARASVWANSESLWNDVLAKDPANLSARLRLCAARKLDGDYKGAEEAMRPALETHSDNATVHFGMARLLMEQERYQEAEHHVERGVALAPDDVRGKQLKVELPLRRRDVKEAVENLKPLIEVEGSMSAVYSDIGKLFQQQGAQDPALACFERALKDATDAQKPDILNSAGISLVGMGRADLALNQYRKALNYDPKNMAALLNAASICKDMNMPEDALQYLQRAFIIDRANPHLHRVMKEFADRYPQLLRQYQQQAQR